MILSNHTAIGGAEGWCDSYLHSKDICTIGCCQMTWTSSIPGSLMESWHRLWPCVSNRWLGESPYRCIVAHLSYCINKVWFIKRCQTLLLFGSHIFTLFLDRMKRRFEIPLSLSPTTANYVCLAESWAVKNHQNNYDL